METSLEAMEVTQAAQAVQAVQDAVYLNGDDITMEQEPGTSSDTTSQGLALDHESPTSQLPDNGCDSNDQDRQNGEVPHVEGGEERIQLGQDDLSVQPGRQYPIEVVLHPPSNPDSYEPIPLSWTIEYILDEVEVGEDVFYSVEFDDGRIDQVAYDDLLDLRGGRRAVQRFEEQRFTWNQSTMSSQAPAASKRPLPEEEYEESESEYEQKPKKRSKRISTRRSSRQASIDNEPEDYDFDELPAPTATTGRVTRSRNPAVKNYNIDDSGDELAQPDSDDGDTPPIVRSDLGPHIRASARKRRKPKMNFTSRQLQRQRQHFDSDSSIEFEPTRRSQRVKTTKSMRDLDVDNDYEYDYEGMEAKATNAPKHAATKEIFSQLPPDSQFPKMHSDTCDTCGSASTKSALIYCQGCSNSYHKMCIGIRSARDHRVTKVGEDNFVLQCKYCIGLYQKKDKRAPKHSMCTECKLDGPSCAEFSPKRTPKQEEKARLDNGGEDPVTKVDPNLVNNAEGVMFRCASCRRAYHFEHLPALTIHGDDVKDIKEDRLEEYSLTEWKCKVCLEAELRIGGLIAWRPVDQKSYRMGQTCLDFGEDAIEYLVKWESRSHFHDTWIPGAWIYGVAAHAMRTAFSKRDSSQLPKMDSMSAIEEEWLLADVLLSVKYRDRAVTSTREEDLARIDNIRSVYVKFQGLGYEDVVWDEPPRRDSGAPWDAFYAAYDEYLNGEYFLSVPGSQMRDRIAQYRDLDFGEKCELKSQPPHLTRGKLMEYQLEGVNYLLYNFHQQQNVILADEMGLGKTVQIVAFISSLVQDQPKCWPFLVVVPNSTCPNWRRELKQWAPDLRVVTYHGGKVAQDLSYRHELFPEGQKAGMKAHVVIMSYEAASAVKSVFQGVKWVGLIVDEGQRLKNEDTQLYKSLQDMKIPCRILLTGTPLQNNKRELFNLLQFIDPKRNAEELDAKYAVLTKENLPELHGIIRPYFLRRTKAQVLKFLPPMGQIIIPVTMTVLQAKLSKLIMARNSSLIQAIISKQRIKAGERKSLNNILSDIRQCLCHPFCFNADVEDKTVSAEQMHRNLVEASSKLVLLNIMLPKLKERGHRVLIFSQFLHSLTILEDFLTGLGLEHGRIDGRISALEKQKRIDAFNAPDSPLFAMLLSTRAGGVGINLATADTVIIYDPDFNPHQDIQALSRAHRIGQKNKVLCFQLMTKDTVEEKIMQMGRKKMALDHALIESIDATEDAGEDLESILKHGAAALFSDESAKEITYDSASVDKLLSRSQIENTSDGDDKSAETQFSFARVWANKEGELKSNLDDSVVEHDAPAHPSIWENILKLREEEHQREVAAQQQEYGRGARRRGVRGVDYNRVGFESWGSEVDEDELYIDNNDIDVEEDEYESEGETQGAKDAKAGNLQPGAQPTNQMPDQAQPQMGSFRSSQVLPPSNIPPPFQPARILPPSSTHQSSNLPPQQVTTATNPPNFEVSIPRRETLPQDAPNPRNGWIGGGDPCTICWNIHSTMNPCVNMYSEVSLRVAIDSLRTSAGDDPRVGMSREVLIIMLRQLTGRNNTEGG